LKLYDPTGALEITDLHASRLDTLEGKTICELSIDSWQFDRTFPLIRELLKRQFPTIKFIPYTEFPSGIMGIDSEEAADLVVKKGCHAAIIGNAG
jgi:hypothetical protein